MGVNDRDGSGSFEGCGATTGLRVLPKYGETRGSSGFGHAGSRYLAGDTRFDES